MSAELCRAQARAECGGMVCDCGQGTIAVVERDERGRLICRCEPEGI